MCGGVIGCHEEIAAAPCAAVHAGHGLRLGCGLGTGTGHLSPGRCPLRSASCRAGSSPWCSSAHFYFDTESLTGAKSEAWAVGGWAGVRSPWWADMFQVGVLGYTSQKLYGPDDKDGTRLLMPGQEVVQRARRGLGRREVLRPDVHRLSPAHQSAVHQSAGQPDGAQHLRGVHAVGGGERRELHRRLHRQDEDPQLRQLRLDVHRGRQQGHAQGRGLRRADLGLHEERLRAGGRAVRQRPVQ